MRLINTTTIQLEEFFNKDVPDYAILSHRWEYEEVTLEDFKDSREKDMVGYSKIQRCCSQALLDGWHYAWVDTCCIDKSSSAELSEAINSMFKWYKNSRVCYAYLSDVPTREMLEDHCREGSAFRLSEWFKRGWTLQELLAPEIMVFFDQSWREIGTKLMLRQVLSSITRINHLLNYNQASVAQKFSWASERRTTRIEDQAYSLMGIFQINMPLIYGEGHNAFLRLQLEIIRNSDDESIFAWTVPWTSDYPGEMISGLLATSPAAFSDSGTICHNETLKIFTEDEPRAPYSMTNKGLHIQGWLIPTYHMSNEFIVPLKCTTKDSDAVCIRLREVNKDTSQFVRIDLQNLYRFDRKISKERCEKKAIYICQKDLYSQPSAPLRTFLVKMASPYLQGFIISEKIITPSTSGYFSGSMGLEKGGAGELLLELKNGHSQLDLYLQDQMNSDNKQDRFSIVLKNSETSLDINVGLAILVPRDSYFDPNFEWGKPYPYKCNMDRVSRSLPSGRSVSATLKKSGMDTYERRGKTQNYVVEVIIHTDGALPWFIR